MNAGQTTFHALVVLVYSLLAPLAAVAFFRRYRLPRPAIGTFNGSDIAVLMGFVVVLPIAYLALSGWALPPALGLIFFGGLMVGYEPVVRRGAVRATAIVTLLAVVVVAFHAMSSGRLPPAWYTLTNSAVILLLVVSAANMSAQGGLHLSHVTVFALALALYDGVFASVIPITQRLAEAVADQPFAPMVGLRIGELGSGIGMGDLLVYAVYGAVAYKAYGGAGVRLALALIAGFGALLPALAPAVVNALTGEVPSLIPAQLFFGPAALFGYLLLRSRGPERRMADLPAMARRAG